MKTVAEILCDLISIRSDSNVSTNQSIVCYITKFLKEYEIPFELIASGNLNNIVAAINVPYLKNIDNGIILSGHMDTVGASMQNWVTDPFQGVQKGGRIFGRGAMDMKYFIAVVLSLLPQLKKISLPILLAFSCDEETNVFGIKDIISFLQKQNVKPKYALIGEATDFKLAVSNRGCIGYQTQVCGVAGHAGNPEFGVNAIYIASKIISKIEELNQIYYKEGITLNVGKIQGGNGSNSISDSVLFDWEIRYKNDFMKNKILEEIKTYCENIKIKYFKSDIFNNTKENLPVFEEKAESILFHVAKEILKTKKIPYPYVSEAGFFQSLGIDTLICGAGNIKLAHTSNEYILKDDIEKYRSFLLDLLDRIAVYRCI